MAFVPLIAKRPNFNPLPSYEGRPCFSLLALTINQISIHSPHTRGDRGGERRVGGLPHFNPLPSYEGRPGRTELRELLYTFQSTPLIRGETEFAKACIKPEYISIHSPHTRGDGYVNARARTLENFNPLPSYEGRQSQHQLLIENSNFNPLPSYEGRPGIVFPLFFSSYFNPLPSYEGRRGSGLTYTLPSSISIHSPHTRGDGLRRCMRLPNCHFNPLPSYEGRLAVSDTVITKIDFNPLPSYEGRQEVILRHPTISRISIHSPHTRGDKTIFRIFLLQIISIHSPHTRGDLRAQAAHKVELLFQSTPLIRGETQEAHGSCDDWQFQSTPLIRGETGWKPD